MRAGFVAALVGAALLVAGCTEKMAGDARAMMPAPGEASSAPASTTAPTTASSSLPSSADFPSSIPQTEAPAQTRPSPLPSSVPCEYEPDTSTPAAKQVEPPANGEVRTTGTVIKSVDLITSVGQISIKFDSGLGPCAVNSFVNLVQQRYFNDTPCHRLTTDPALQVLQCGDPSGKGTGGPGYRFKDELWPGMKYGRGTVAMANAGPDTNGSQFFIVYGGADGLPPNYTIFGTVDTASLRVIDNVAQSGVNPTNGPGDGRPIMPVTISSTLLGN